MYTEDEAREKWCPFARCGNDIGCNRGGDQFTAGPLCIASQCMAWRWEQSYQFAKNKNGTIMATPDGEPLYKMLTGMGVREIGWCGLAGAPS